MNFKKTGFQLPKRSSYLGWIALFFIVFAFLSTLSTKFAFSQAQPGAIASSNPVNSPNRGFAAQTKYPELVSSAREKQISQAVEILLKSTHLSKKPTDETLSERAFDLYMKVLDSKKAYFYQSDVDEFSQNAKNIGAMITRGNVDFAFDVFNLYLKRIDERIETVMKILDEPVNFDTDEEIVIDRKQYTYPKTPQEAKTRWEKQTKLELLALKSDEIEKARSKALKEAKEKAKEKGETFDESAYEAPSYTQLYDEAPDWDTLQKRLKRRYIYYQKRMHQTNNDELLEYFLTSVANSYDPHTSYMSPSSYENFLIQMRLNLDGIGATLTSIDGFTVVNKLVPGGAAAKSELLKAEDRIVAVGQNATGPMVDVFDMKLNDVVDKVRGRRGTQVRLEIVSQEGVDKYAEYKEEGKPKPETKTITITREKIELDDQAAKSEIFEVGTKPNGTPYKVGVIDLPSFYFDLEAARKGDRNFRSTTEDTRRILRHFVAKGVDAVVIDLRMNGGGSLQEVVTFTGLFIETGTVVMTKDTGSRVNNLDDRDPSVEWTGPLTVVINKCSASASEIFAGAIKDYQRGLIVGDSTTHGKGSVQELKDIGEILLRGIPNSSRFGALKLTVQGYYLPSGKSPQLDGVTSNVELPSLVNHLENISEKDLDYPLTFEPIPKANRCPTFPYVNEAVVSEIQKKSAVRVQEDPEFQQTLKDIQIYLDYKAKKTRTLNEKKYFEERERLQAEKKEVEKLSQSEEDVDKDKIDRNYYLDEVMNITVDYILALDAKSIGFPKERTVRANPGNGRDGFFQNLLRQMR